MPNVIQSHIIFVMQKRRNRPSSRAAAGVVARTTKKMAKQREKWHENPWCVCAQGCTMIKRKSHTLPPLNDQIVPKSNLLNQTW